MPRVSVFGFLAFSTFFIFSLFYSLILAAPNLFSFDTKLVYQSSKNIFLDSNSLNTIDIVIRSSDDLSQGKWQSRKCNIFSEIKKNDGNTYLFSVKFFRTLECESGNIHLSVGDDRKYTLKLKVIHESELMNSFSDYPSSDLDTIFGALEKQILSSSYDPEVILEDSSNLKEERKWKELNYTKNIVENIRLKRKEKYLVPVSGYTIGSTHARSRIPNAPRPYRAAYTDGIHHGWDVGSRLGEEVIALDDGVIVRVVPEFSWDDFQRIVHGDNLSEIQKIKNLDVLRGKQAWLKTTRGDIVLYSHLDDIYTHVYEGAVIRKGQPIGTVGISGVPDRNYTDYHLHFAIHKNPYNSYRAGKYSIDDYLLWDWYYKDKDAAYILEAHLNLFEPVLYE